MTKTYGNSQVSPYEIKLINMSLEEMIERSTITSDTNKLRNSNETTTQGDKPAN